jgi:hypothetical protein
MNFIKPYYVKPQVVVDKYEAILSLISSKLQEPEVVSSKSATKYLESIRMSVNGLNEEEKDGETTEAQAKSVIDGFTTQIINKRYLQGGRTRRRRLKRRKTHRRRK